MKTGSWIALVVMCIATAIVVYIGVFSIVANSEKYYFSKYEEFGVYNKFNVSDEYLQNETRFLLNYLENGKGRIDSSWYKEREIEHLMEVRDLYKKVYLLQSVCVLLVVMSLLAVVFLNGRTDEGFVKRVLSRYLIGTGIAVFGMFVFFLVMMLTFSSSFITFHEVLFKTDTWMLDPAIHNLIKMFPQQFFFDMFIRIGVFSLLVGCLFLVIGYFVREKVKPIKEKLNKSKKSISNHKSSK